MDLSQRTVEEVVHPTAAFLRASDEARLYSKDAQQPSWGDSILNPKNRIDSLDLPDRPLWRIDGCTGLGTQYYAVPINVRVGANHNLELQLLPLKKLNALWGATLEPLQIVDFFDVHVVSVLHDSVCLVRIHGQLFIFKALVGGIKYLYHELKTLCSVEPHANIISRPIHLISKACSFGGKHAIVGFTTFYHRHGSVRDILPQLRIRDRLQRESQIKWCIQVTQALEHLRTRSSIYYPDLRLDNIVMSENFDIVMVDFEQRGVWCEFAAPEVNAIEYMRLVAVDDRMPSEVTSKYLEIMRGLVPDYDRLQDDQYTNPEDGYNASWIALSPEEQELAEVYMLGRLMWCIFEGVSGPQKAAVWQSYRWESNLEFPEYDRTPPAMRELIDRCTRGTRPNLGSVIVRRQSQLLLRHRLEEDHDANEVQAAAMNHWVAELKWAEEFLSERTRLREQGLWNHNYYNRPRLQEVLEALLKIQAQYTK
ncbi:hypothetical protein ONZ43_g6527 [Nemania bipapillata]|uniref:Uncharacterized protein n=1 Tax=Nemania bipapillata TaxID=110536 RepID=A0ACC2HYD6_9PEZI|nr:hypothetical protein ONZ43_g6527 [Nemania bipapillata]